MRLFKQLMKAGLLADISKLISGTVIGRLIVFLAMPILTRLYTPEHFQILAVYVAFVGTIGVVACLRFEIAIPIAANDDDAFHLLVLALISALTVSLAVMVFFWLAPMQVNQLLINWGVEPFGWLIGLGVLAAATYAATQYWATRTHAFGKIARTRIEQASLGTATMLGLGWAGIAPFGLVLGHMFTIGAGGVRLGLNAFGSNRSKISALTVAKLSATARSYARYPIFSTWDALANTASVQLPVLLIATASATEAGQLFVAMQIMFVPMSLIGSSTGQVYLSRAHERLKDGTLAQFTTKIMKQLFLFGLVPSAVAMIAAPFLFPIVLGSGWERAGEIAVWIAPWMLFQLTVSPVSMALNVLDRQRLGMILQFFALAFRSGAVWAALFLDLGMVEMFALSGVVFYCIYSVVVIRVIRGH